MAVLLVSMLGLLLTPSIGAELGNDGKPLNGMAPLYILHGRYWSDFSLTATLDLPMAANNKSWYAIWIMVLEAPKKGLERSSFIQVGLIRQPNRTFVLQPFIALQRETDAGITFQDYPVEQIPGRYRFMIRGQGNRIDLFINERVLASMERSNVFPAETKLNFQLAPEVFAEGDAIAGSIGDILVKGDSDIRPESVSPTCRHFNHGVFLLPDGGVYKAQGVFDRSRASYFEGQCW